MNTTYIEELMCVKYIEKKDKIRLQKELRKLPPLRDIPNGQEVSINKLDETVKFMIKKWNVDIQWISHMATETDEYYSVGVVRKRYTKEGKFVENVWIGNCYGKTIYELFVKIVLRMFYSIKEYKIEKRLSQ